MRKKMLFATLASVALAGCVNEENYSESETCQLLTFDAPVITTQTRAVVKGEMTGNVYDNREKFKVFCKIYSTEDGYQGWESNENSGYKTQDYFSKEGEIASHNGSYWATDNTHIWPNDGAALAFSAVSPSSVQNVTCGTGGITITDFMPETTSDNQYDLMYSDRTINRTKENNAGREVALTFRHALSSIVFSTTSESTDVTYVITAINISSAGGFQTKGTFQQNLTYDTSSKTFSGTPSWSVKSSDNTTPAQSYTPTLPDGGVTVTATPTIFTAGDKALLLIPQIVPTDAKVDLKYTATTKSPEVTTTHEISINLSEFKIVDAGDSGNSIGNPIAEWKMGQRYIYRIAFGETQHIYFKPNVVDWLKGGTAVYTIQ